MESRSELPLKVGGLQVSCFAALSSMNAVGPSDPQEKEQGDIAMGRRGLPGRGLGTVARKSPSYCLMRPSWCFPLFTSMGSAGCLRACGGSWAEPGRPFGWDNLTSPTLVQDRTRWHLPRQSSHWSGSLHSGAWGTLDSESGLSRPSLLPGSVARRGGTCWTHLDGCLLAF